MKFPHLAFALIALPLAAPAQVDFPSNPMVGPKKMTTPPTGGGANPGASIDPTAENRKVRYVTHIILQESRLWTNTDGVPLEAKLIAFEDLVAESSSASEEPVMPSPPVHPTLIREGKIRLLINRKPVVLALDRLSQPDQQLIAQIQASLARKAAERK